MTPCRPSAKKFHSKIGVTSTKKKKKTANGGLKGKRKYRNE